MPSKRRSDRREKVSRRILAGFFVFAGVMHFVKPAPYESIMPPQLPAHRELVYVSGVAEIVGGIAVCSSRLRPWAGWWLIALLLAVFPANVYHALAAEEIPGNPVPKPALYARLPLQALLVAWVWRATDPAAVWRPRSRVARARAALRRRG